MPCQDCNTGLIYIEDIPTCPSCEPFKIIPNSDALQIIEHFIEKTSRVFDLEIEKYKKYEVINTIFGKREKIVRKILEEYSAINVREIFLHTLLIKRLMCKDNFLEIEEITIDKIDQIIRMFDRLVSLEEDKIHLETRTFDMLHTETYDLKHIMKLQHLPKIYHNEKYQRIREVLLKHNIMNNTEANEKMDEWKKDFVRPVRGSNQCKSSKELIRRFYELISSLYTVFFRNRLAAEAFSIDKQDKNTIDSIELLKFVGEYQEQDQLSYDDVTAFKSRIVSKFGDKTEQFFNSFVLSEDNCEAMPLFVRCGKDILISQHVINLFAYVLAAVTNKDEFNKETEKRSKIYESKIVKKHFEKLKFRYIPNYKIKKLMEIDGIAISNKLVHVIEAKGWGSKKLIEEKFEEETICRAIHNAIDGYHKNVNSGKIRPTVSLQKKVEWVKNNKKLLRIKIDAEIKGMLVINEPPPLAEYNNCNIVFVDDFLLSKK